MCCGQKGGDARWRWRGEEGGEGGQCTWSQPPSFPSRLPGSPRLHRTLRLPGSPHPCAQPLQKQPLLAPRTPRLRLLAVMRMLLAQLAPPRTARLPQRPLKLLPAAMTAPRAARRGVRLRERRRRPPRGGVGTRGRPRGSRQGSGAGVLAAPKWARCSRSARRAPGPARKDLAFQEPTLPLPPTPDLGRRFGKCWPRR